MAGHSKWANRKHRKERQDARKGKIFSRMAKEISVAVREGGPDPDANPRLRLAIEKAKSYSVPAENIERAIQRGAGGGPGEALEQVLYEGYGPGGVAILVEALTDNRNRTTSEIRHLFSRHGGNLGEAGCVAWMFERKGLIVTAGTGDLDEDDLILHALEGGAEDVRAAEDGEQGFEIITPVAALEPVRARLAEAGVEIAEAGLTMLPQSEIPVEGAAAAQLIRLLDALEDHDDVQEVYSNSDIDSKALAEAGY